MRGGADQKPLSDGLIEDTEAAVVGRSKGAVSPTSEEVVFPVEEIHFEHEIFCNMMVEGGLRWLAEW